MHVISDCYRKEYSALDINLQDKSWNCDGINHLLSNKVERVLCTSKQVIKWLDKRIINKNQFSFQEKQARKIQNILLSGITDTEVDCGIVKVYYSDKLAKTIEVIAIPTPGGNTYRRLDRFGYNHQFEITNVSFLEAYLIKAFKWLNFRIDL